MNNSSHNTCRPESLSNIHLYIAPHGRKSKHPPALDGGRINNLLRPLHLNLYQLKNNNLVSNFLSSSGLPIQTYMNFLGFSCQVLYGHRTLTVCQGDHDVLDPWPIPMILCKHFLSGQTKGTTHIGLLPLKIHRHPSIVTYAIICCYILMQIQSRLVVNALTRNLKIIDFSREQNYQFQP